MDSTHTINSWKDKIKAKLLSEHFYSFSSDQSFTLPITNDNSTGLFSSVLNGDLFIFGELEDVSFMSKAMSDYLEAHSDVNVLFTNKVKNEQISILNNIILRNNHSINNASTSIAYLSFGKLTYTIEGRTFQAPLVFIPVRVFKSSKDNLYRLMRLNKEIKLNEPLIDMLKKERKIDLSYPVNKDFSLSEYLYYLSIKVKPINWSVNNETYLSCFDFSYYHDLKYINSKQNIIAQNQLIKKIAYFNSEFYSFNQKEAFQLDNKFLSLLDMESEEYSLLKRISKRDNLLIRCEQHSNKYHFLTNIILTYLLNNKRVLLVYSNNEERLELLKEIRKSSIDKFVLDLSLGSINKEDTLASLASYERFTIPYNSLHPIAIDEDVTRYYNLKNSFQSIINNLRTTRNPLKTSINKIINNYYALDKYPLLDVSFKSTNKIDLEVLQQYLQIVKEFADSIEHLNCPIEEHPFYGFNKKEMRKDDYKPLKDSIILLSSTIKDAKLIYEYGAKKYDLPKATTLKEMKALLNILSFVEYYKHLPLDWLNDANIDQTYDNLVELYGRIEVNEKALDNICSLYPSLKEKVVYEDLDRALNQKNAASALNKLRKTYIKKHIPKNECEYLFRNIHKHLHLRNKYNDEKQKYYESYHTYLSEHTFEELRSVINNINSYRLNLEYIKHHDGFDIAKLILNTNIEVSKHRQAMQIVYNSILISAKTVHHYFDHKVLNYETMELDAYFDKIDKMALNFGSINDYIDYYVSRHRINRTMNHLGDRLLECGSYRNFENIFLKRFYYDLLTACLKNNKTAQELSRKNIFSLLENFKDSDNERKSLIEKIIYNNFNKNTSTSLYNIKTTEGSSIRNLLQDPDLFINLTSLCESFPLSIHNFKPCILTSYKNVSQYLKNDEYQFDSVIILSNRLMDVKDTLPALCKGKQLLIIDQKPITEDIRTSLITTSNPSNLVVASKTTFHELVYSQVERNALKSMQNNLYDLDFKAYLVTKLAEFGFDVTMNRPINDQVIDILVKVKNSNVSIAIVVDHFPYYSPEEASETFYYQEQFLKEHGYSPYRIFTGLYFLDEENELNKLVEYIVAQSKLIPQINAKKNTILLMDYLFPLYKDPRHKYFELANEENLSKKLSQFLEACAPISLEEIRLIFKENISETLDELKANGTIEIVDDFIIIPGKKIIFRRVDRTKEYYRPLDLVCDQELYNAVYGIINYKSSLSKDTIIKMILLSLGYKKANKEKLAYVEERINYLLEQKIIFIENNVLYKSI